MKRIFSIISFLFFAYSALAQDVKNQAPLTEVWKPEVRTIDAGQTNAMPPSDAIILFDGKNTSAWQGRWRCKMESG